jgi:hypothetical protein
MCAPPFLTDPALSETDLADLRPGGVIYVNTPDRVILAPAPRRYECFGCGAPVQSHEVQCSYCARPV